MLLPAIAYKLVEPRPPFDLPWQRLFVCWFVIEKPRQPSKKTRKRNEDLGP